MAYNHKKRKPMPHVCVGMDIEFVRDVTYGRVLIKKGRKAYVLAFNKDKYGYTVLRLAFHTPLTNLNSMQDEALTRHVCGFRYTKEFPEEFVLIHCKRKGG